VNTDSSGKRATSSAFVVLVAAAVGCAGHAPGSGESVPGASTVALHPAVDFAFESLDERPVSAETLRGKVTLIVFLTTSSLPAQAQVDFLVAMAKHDADHVNYAAVALEQRDDRELVEMYRKSLAIPFPMAVADTATLHGQGPFGDVSAVPVTVILDRAGRMVWRVDGRVAKSDELRAAMRGL